MKKDYKQVPQDGDSASPVDDHQDVQVSEQSEQDLLDRLCTMKRQMENKRVMNLAILPFSFMLMIFVMTMYPNKIVLTIICLFMIPSIIFNVVFIFSSHYGKVSISQKISLFWYKVFMVGMGLLYVMNLVLVFGNLTLIDFANGHDSYIAAWSMFIFHFSLQISWMFFNFQ